MVAIRNLGPLTSPHLPRWWHCPQDPGWQMRKGSFVNCFGNYVHIPITPDNQNFKTSELWMNSCLKQIAISCKPEITLDKKRCCSHPLPPLLCMFLSTNEQEMVSMTAATSPPAICPKEGDRSWCQHHCGIWYPQQQNNSDSINFSSYSTLSFQLHPKHDLVANPPIPSFLALMVSPPFPINARICTPSMRMILKRAGSIPSDRSEIHWRKFAGRFLIWFRAEAALLKGMENANIFAKKTDLHLCDSMTEIHWRKKTYLRYISSCIYTY